MLRLSPARRCRNQRGFTLLELMYAFGYFMLGIAGLTFFHSVAAQGTQRAADISMATMLGSGTIESLRVQQGVTIALPTTTTTLYDRFGYPSTSPQYSGTPYFTVTATSSQPSGATYFETVVSTTWQQLPITFQHGVVLQTRIPTPQEN